MSLTMTFCNWAFVCGELMIDYSMNLQLVVPIIELGCNQMESLYQWKSFLWLKT